MKSKLPLDMKTPTYKHTNTISNAFLFQNPSCLLIYSVALFAKNPKILYSNQYKINKLNR